MDIKKWTVFRHNGPFFPSLYQRHNKDIFLNETKINVPDIVEEYLTLYAKYLGTIIPKILDLIKNFLDDLIKVLPRDIKVNSMNDFDLSNIKKYLDVNNQKKKELSKETKIKLKDKQELLKCHINIL